MSILEKNYNWNGEYKLLDELQETRFKVSGLEYPEYFYIFVNEDNTLRYTIIDDNFGMPCLGNTMDTPHALKLRENCEMLLNHLCYKGIIEKIGCNHSQIIVAHYAHHIEGEIGDRLACRVRCENCGKLLFKSEDKGVEATYVFIEENKDKFETLFDMTCDNLNKRFDIKENDSNKTTM